MNHQLSSQNSLREREGKGEFFTNASKPAGTGVSVITTPHQSIGACPHCGGSDLAMGVKLSQTAEVGSIGLSYKANALFYGTAPLYADLCRTCGTVTRLFVRETDKRWITK